MPVNFAMRSTSIWACSDMAPAKGELATAAPGDELGFPVRNKGAAVVSFGLQHWPGG